jgi:hypothetical protein
MLLEATSPSQSFRGALLRTAYVDARQLTRHQLA